MGAAQTAAQVPPKEMIDRDKQGFVLPIDGWLRVPCANGRPALDPRASRMKGGSTRHLRHVWTTARSGSEDVLCRC